MMIGRAIRRLAVIAGATVSSTLAGYAVAYYALIVPGYVPGDFVGYAAHLRRTSTGPVTITVERTHAYRVGGEWIEALFAVAHDVDCWLRPGVWSETFVFSPLVSESDREAER